MDVEGEWAGGLPATATNLDLESLDDRWSAYDRLFEMPQLEVARKCSGDGIDGSIHPADKAERWPTADDFVLRKQQLVLKAIARSASKECAGDSLCRALSLDFAPGVVFRGF